MTSSVQVLLKIETASISSLSVRPLLSPRRRRGDAYFGMNPTFPVDRENDLTSSAVDLCHNLLHQSSRNSFLQCRVCCLIVPYCFQLFREVTKFCGLRRCCCIRPERLDSKFQFMDMIQRAVPAPFKLTRNKPIFRIGSIVLPLRSVDCIPCCFQITLESRKYVLLNSRFFIARLQSGFDCGRPNHVEYLSADTVIHRNASERDAPRFTVVQPATIACISQHVMLGCLCTVL